MAMAEDVVLSSLISELILEQCFEMHYAVKVGEISLDELYGVDPIDNEADACAEVEKESKNPTPKHSINVSCPICKESVAGQRFAPHLEKCLNGGKRGGLVGNKKSASLSSLGIGLPYCGIAKKVDNYPQSLVVRMRLKDGVPKRNQLREGAQLAEFVSWKEIELAVIASSAIQEDHQPSTSKMDIAT